MRISGRCLVVAAAASFLFAGARVVEAAAPPVIDQAYSVTTAHSGMTPVAAGTVVTVIGKSLTKFTGFSLEDSFGMPVMAPVTTLVRSKKMLVLLLPEGLADGAYFVSGALGNGTAIDIPARVSDLSSPGMVNDFQNPVDWTRLKGIPDGVLNGATWTQGMGTAYRSSGRVGIGTAAPASTLHVSGTDGVLFEGTLASGTLPATGTGTRMMWYPKRAAFRAGYVFGTNWDDASVGDYSVAMGYAGIASGGGSTALGTQTTASGLNATALGAATTAGGSASLATGSFTSATGLSSASMGDNTAASGYSALAAGHYTSATGDFSAVFGEYNTAQAYDSVVLGRYNVVAGTPGSWVATDPLLVAGNGTVVTPSNALTLLKNGNLTIAGTLTQNSDERLKRDVAPLTGVLGRIAGIRGVTYRMKDGERGPGGAQIGLLAQEVRAAFPELVHEDTRGTLSVAYGNFSAVLLAAIQEQQSALEARDRELADLRREMAKDRASLEERIARLEALLAAPPAAGGGR